MSRRARTAADPRRRRLRRRTRRGWASSPTRRVCIGCKACEVACKEWNDVPEDGLELHRRCPTTTPARSAPTPGGTSRSSSSRRRQPARRRLRATPRAGDRTPRDGIRWLMSSDVCKHCTARRLPGRLPDRRAVPHRVRHRRRAGGRLQRLRLLRPGLPVRRDRPARGRRPGLEVHALLRPARATAWSRRARKACPTESIQFGDARRAARARRGAGSSELHDAGRRPRPGSTAHDPDDGVGGDGAFFLLLDEPEVYGLPPDPVVTTRDLRVDVAARRRRRRWRCARSRRLRRGGPPGEAPR